MTVSFRRCSGASSAPVAVRRPRAADVQLRNDGDVDRLRALLTLTGLVRDLRPIGERLEAVTGDAAVMHEEVLRPLGRGDEPVTLRIVEPLNGSFCHGNTPPYTTHERARKAHRAQTGPALATHNGSSRNAKRSWEELPESNRRVVGRAVHLDRPALSVSSELADAPRSVSVRRDDAGPEV